MKGCFVNSKEWTLDKCVTCLRDVGHTRFASTQFGRHLSILWPNNDQNHHQMNDKVPSPSSSPPEAGSPKMAPATRKRSHEEMNAKSKDAQASSNVAVEDDNTAKSQRKHTEDDASSSATMKPDNVSSSMPPPSLPASKVLSQKPPRSGQRSVLSTQALQQGEKVDAVPDDSNPGQDTHSNQHSSTDGEDEEDDELDAPTSSEPEHAIDDFDWSDLQERYHDRMKQLDDQESTIINEFNSLCDARLFYTKSSTFCANGHVVFWSLGSSRLQPRD